MDPEDLLDGHLLAKSVYDKVRSCLVDLGKHEVRTSKSQIAFRRKRGFAYLWLPGQYLKNPGAEVVLSIAVQERPRSAPEPRFPTDDAPAALRPHPNAA